MNDDLFSIVDKPAPGSNLPEFTVTQIAGGIKKTLEETYGRVRIRGEISQPKLHSSGHLYLSLKDEGALIDAVCWKGSVSKLSVKPAEGMEVIATGRITTYGRSSKYQLVIEEMALAGQGALLAMLEARKKALTAEGLFDTARKKDLPYLPQVIGIVTSPTGAVIRDILHRLEDRFPVHVLLWPVAVQGAGAAEQITAAIEGFNNLPDHIQTPDLLIVARGGGSMEDLMAFNEENVVRAAAASRIPLISGVGHEPDFTLIDFAADVRAPTPTAAAEMAVPVRRELLAGVQETGRRTVQLLQNLAERGSLKLTSLSRALGDPQRLLESRIQRVDETQGRLTTFIARLVERRQHVSQQLASRLIHPRAQLNMARQKLDHSAAGLPRGMTANLERLSARLERAGALLNSHSYQKTLERGFVLIRRNGEPVTQAAALNQNDNVVISFGDGTRSATVTD